LKIIAICILFWTAQLPFLYAQSIQLQGVVSGAHTEISNSTLKLSGSFGQPIANTNSSILSSGFYSALANLLLTNFPPDITVPTGNEFTQFVLNTTPTISAEISDLDGIDWAALRIRPIGSESFDSVVMTSGAGKTYSYTLTSNNYDKMGVEYYFVASDLTNRRKRHPASNNLYAYATNPLVIFPNTLINPGSATDDYRMISVPYEINLNAVASLLKDLVELGPYDKTKWRLFSHDGGNNFIEYPNGSAQNLDRGKGYWLLVSERENQQLDLGTNVTASENNQSKLFSMTLHPGWNMIGNPYTVSISWENVLAFNPGVGVGALKIFEGDYVNGDELLPFQGGIAFLEGTANVSIDIPFINQTELGGRVSDHSFESDLAAPNWAVDFKIQQGNHVNRLGGIGMHMEAEDNKDSFDDLNPPRFLSYLEMNFPHPEHSLGFFSRDIVTTKTQQKWAFSINSNENGPITHSWDNSLFGDNPVEIYIHDIQNNKIVDMRVSSEIRVNNNSSLEIYYGNGVLGAMGPANPFVGAPYPNPMSTSWPSLNFPLALTGKGNSYRVEAIIYSMEGRLIKEIFNGELSNGLHNLNWDGKSINEQKALPGMYLYSIKIGYDTGQANFTGKLIISN
jgi:hypothetical protein